MTDHPVDEYHRGLRDGSAICIALLENHHANIAAFAKAAAFLKERLPETWSQLLTSEKKGEL